MSIDEKTETDEIREFNPLMIQSYFDGELKSDEFGTVSHDELVNTPTWKALDELRQVVKTDAEMEYDRIDAYALLNAINAQIDAESKPAAAPEPVPLPTGRRSSAGHRVMRWMPAIIGAALFLLSIPGLVQLVSGDDDDAGVRPSTVVYINDTQAQAKNPDANMRANELIGEINSMAYTVAMPANAKPHNNSDDQLTVRELDYALRRLVDRIETLEEANRHQIETGRTTLDLDSEGKAPAL